MYHPVNSKFPPKLDTTEQYSYHGRPKVREYVSVAKKILFKLITSFEREGYVPQMMAGLLKQMKYFTTKQELFMDLHMPSDRYNFFPSPQLIEEWLNW